MLAHGAAGEYRVEYQGRTHAISGARLQNDDLSLRLDSEARRFLARTGRQGVTTHDGQRRLHLELVSVYRPLGSSSTRDDSRIVAPMPGRVVVVKSSPGQTVKAGQELLVIEAMKMELAIKAPRDGIVAALHAAAGDFVEADAVLATLETE
jgi:3-methylcrotonyl-CoA carboxylase alpha subunit